MTSGKFLRSMSGPLRSFSTTASNSTTSSDQEESSTPTTTASTANTSVSSRNNSHGSKPGDANANARLSNNNAEPTRQEAPSQPSLHPLQSSQPSRTLSGARDVKAAILDKFASLKPSPVPPRSRSWSGRRFSAFLPGQSSSSSFVPPVPTNTTQQQQTGQSKTHSHKPFSLSSSTLSSNSPRSDSQSSPQPTSDSAVAWRRPFGGSDHTRANSVAEPASSSHSIASAASPRQSFDPGNRTPKRSFTVDTLDKSPRSSTEGAWGSRQRHNTVAHLPYSPESTPSRLAVQLPVLQLQLPNEAIAVPPSPPGATPTHADFSSSLQQSIPSSCDPESTKSDSGIDGRIAAPDSPPDTPARSPQHPPAITEEEEAAPEADADREKDAMMMHTDRAQHPHQFAMPLRKESLPPRKDSLGASPSVRTVPPVPSALAAVPRLVSPGPASASQSGSIKSRVASVQIPSQSSSVRSSVGSPRVSSNQGDATESRPSTGASQRQSNQGSSPVVVAPVEKEKDKETTRKLRRSWFPSATPTRSRSNSQDLGQPSAHPCWVMDTKAEYNASLLIKGEKIPELWTEAGDVYVYLFPKETGMGPSFKVPHMVISASVVFNELIQIEWASQLDSRSSSPRRFSHGTHRLSVDDASRSPSPPMLPPNESHLYIVDPPEMRPDPLDPLPDIERLVTLRNVFAFLMGQPLVATKRAPTHHEAFVRIAGVLEEFMFASDDGSSFGEIVDMVFSSYLDKMGLVDLRRGKEKILQALILSERMRCVELYNSAFAHAVGRHEELLALKSPLYEQVTPYTRQKIERSYFNLNKRLDGITVKLDQFDFPSIFVGMAASTSNEDLRKVRFKVWRNSFNKMRAFVVGYYKNSFGSWPPKASNKKNPFSESGLNRLVLKTLYSDMCALYDLLVNRNELTPRELHGLPENIPMDGDGMIPGLRRLLSEFENSLSPTPPPMPFDTPIVPSMTSILETYNELPPKEQLKYQKRIRDNELMLVLNKAYNYDVNALNIRFLDAFKSFEHKEAKGKLAADIADQRMGCWMFLYVVLQSLPMLVVDAPGLKHTDGVEYFLCEAPWGNPPWVEDAGVRKMWYEVAGGTGIVELPADYIMFSTEAIYHRSHCWVAAKEWENMSDPLDGDMIEEPGGLMSPLAPPAHVFQNPESSPRGSPHLSPSSRTPSPGPGSPQLLPPPATSRNPSPNPSRRTSQYRRSSIAIGLEPLTAPESLDILSGNHSNHSGGGYVSRRASSVNPAGYSRSRPVSRVASAGNMILLPNPPLSEMPSLPGSMDAESPGPKEQTFDDILGELPKTKKKKGFF